MTLHGIPVLDALLPDAGTLDEARDYALREASHPEALQFSGGETLVISVSLVALLLILLIVVVLSD